LAEEIEEDRNDGLSSIEKGRDGQGARWKGPDLHLGGSRDGGCRIHRRLMPPSSFDSLTVSSTHRLPRAVSLFH